MARVRKPFEGVFNIIRFNWHFYVISIFVIVFLIAIRHISNNSVALLLNIFLVLFITTIVISVCVSFYIYDVSNLYSFTWLEKANIHFGPDSIIINIHAGFDETSSLLSAKYTSSEFLVFDFYNPQKHTEVSIRRARKVNLPFPGTVAISPLSIPVLTASVDYAFLFLSAHEIRDQEERIIFFKELHRVIKPGGNIIVVEHLRNLPNFLAYNIGFFHFLSKSSWNKTFKMAGLQPNSKFLITPFLTTFILKKNGV